MKKSIINKDITKNTHSHSFLIGPDQHGVRLDRFLALTMEKESVSREKLKRAVKQGAVHIDGMLCTVPKTKLQEGMRIELSLQLAESQVKPEEGELTILYRDPHCAVIDKPHGLTVHPCPSCPDGTLVHRLLHHFPEMRAMEGFRPGIVHRIDKDTSGLLLVALTEQARVVLSEAFANRTVHKEYLAIIKGIPKKAKGSIHEPIGRHPSMKVKMAVVKGGKEAHSEYRVLYADTAADFSLVAVKIHTGRTHQIRVHMSHIGHPLWGDALYGGGISEDDRLAPFASRQMLHAWRLQFKHPVTKEPMKFLCAPPEDFPALITELSRTSQRVIITGMPGCGKSALTTTLKSLGIPAWSADPVVHELYSIGGDGWHIIRGRFGNRFLLETEDGDGPVDRKALFAAMQESASIRKEVESFIHPLVRQDLLNFWKEHKNHPVTIAEVPLYFEAGWREDGNIVVGVATPTDIRHSRLRESRGWSNEMIAAMEAWQWAEKDKMNACDILVDNSGLLTDLTNNGHRLVSSLELRRKEQLCHIQQTVASLWQSVE